ncbi:MAG: hypothetical protein GY947_10300 [Rhodobacteraceae bacterium]|nr:hypothetical protein [Paracoccaceae bacterium]
MTKKTTLPSGLDSDTSTEEFLARFGENQADLKNAISFLIHRRELLTQIIHRAL